MSKHYIHLKIISILLASVLLFQSCKAYKAVPATLEEAFKANTFVKITTLNNKKIIFKRVEKKDSVYYGLQNTNKGLKRVKINEKNITKIQVLNKPKSTTLTVICLSVTAVTIVGIVLIISTLNEINDIDLDPNTRNSNPN